MRKVLAVLCTAIMGLAAAAVADARPLAGPTAEAFVLQATDLPGSKVVSQKAASPGAGLTQYARVLQLSTPYGASRYIVVESIAVVVPSETLGAQTYALLVHEFSNASTRRQLEAGLANAAFGAAKKSAKTKKPAPKIVYSHELHHAVALGDGGYELSFTAASGAKRVSTSVSIFRIGQVIEELVATGVAAHTAEADTLSIGNLVVTRAKAALAPVATAPDTLSLGNLVVTRAKAALAPVATAAPAITGTAQQGQTLTASTGTWTNAPTAYAYQWQHCDATGANCTDIAGATQATYAVTATDVGTTLRVNVTATNASGVSAPAPSAVTAVVS